MLTDEQRRLITDEEVFRDEVRRSLEEQKPPHQALKAPATREQLLQAVTDAQTLLKTEILQPRWTVGLYTP